MSAPMVEMGRLVAVADWELPRIRGGVAALAVAESALASWRLRLEGLGRQLEGARGWAGPAALAAAAELFELAGVVFGVASALEESLAALHRMQTEAAAAQEAASAALYPGVALQPQSVGEALRANALEHAAAAANAIRAAEQAVAHLQHDAAGPQATFTALTHALLAEDFCVAPVPRGLAPDAVAVWFAGLTPQLQLALIAAMPASVGALDGAPAWARDRANRLLLAGALTDPHTAPGAGATARVLAARIAAEEAAGRQVQLHLLDLVEDRVALAFGDLDTADAIAVLVPGIENTPADDLARLTSSARAVGDAAGAAAPELAVTTMVWLGYRTPTMATSVVRTAAWRGGPALASAVAGMAAAREATGGASVRTTLLAHSYGTVVVDEAADEPGELAVDAVVLLGSPGMEGDAESLEAPEVYAAAAADDLIAQSSWFGPAPTWWEYGSTVLPADPFGGHSGYYDVDGPTLPALGEVVTGTRPPG